MSPLMYQVLLGFKIRTRILFSSLGTFSIYIMRGGGPTTPNPLTQIFHAPHCQIQLPHLLVIVFEELLCRQLSIMVDLT